MKIVFYLLTVLFGVFGLLGLLRTFELLILGGKFNIAQIFIAIGALILSWFFLKKARGK